MVKRRTRNTRKKRSSKGLKKTDVVDIPGCLDWNLEILYFLLDSQFDCLYSPFFKEKFCQLNSYHLIDLAENAQNSNPDFLF